MDLLERYIIWVVFAGIPMCFNSISIDIRTGYFRKLLIDQLKFMVLVEFIISSFTFSLVAELILVLFTTFIALLDLAAGMNDDYKTVKKLTSSLLAIIGVVTFFLTIKNIVASFNSINFIDMFVSFMIPIVYLFLFIPVAYLFAIFARYESLFIRMSFKEPADKKIKVWHRWEVFKACRLSYSKVDLFNNAYMARMYQSMSDNSFRSLIDAFKSHRIGEDNVTL